MFQLSTELSNRQTDKIEYGNVFQHVNVQLHMYGCIRNWLKAKQICTEPDFYYENIAYNPNENWTTN